MSFYKKLTYYGTKIVPKHILFKFGFNWSPMYRRSTAKIISVSKNLDEIIIKLPLSYKNRNYVNTIFGGSMFAAVDPIPMVQIMNLLGPTYVVWDKAAEIKFKRPGNQDLYARFSVSEEEIKSLKQKIEEQKEIEIVKTTHLTDKTTNKVFCVVHKTIYIADKAFYKNKKQMRDIQ